MKESLFTAVMFYGQINDLGRLKYHQTVSMINRKLYKNPLNWHSMYWGVKNLQKYQNNSNSSIWHNLVSYEFRFGW